MNLYANVLRILPSHLRYVIAPELMGLAGSPAFFLMLGPHARFWCHGKLDSPLPYPEKRCWRFVTQRRLQVGKAEKRERESIGCNHHSSFSPRGTRKVLLWEEEDFDAELSVESQTMQLRWVTMRGFNCIPQIGSTVDEKAGE